MYIFSKKKYIGKRVGKYTLEKHLGEGRYGLCFLADENSEHKVVIKKLKFGFFKKHSGKNIHEAILLSKLNDNRIPKFLGVINEKNFYAYVLEFKNGHTVKELLFKYNYKFTYDEIFNIGTRLIDIVKYLHGNGIVHGDIRISNVILDGDKVSLIDFGLARYADGDFIPYDMDFSYLGDFLLYLFYSAFETSENGKKTPWYNELPLEDNQKLFLKRLLGLEERYNDVNAVYIDFYDFFKK